MRETRDLIDTLVDDLTPVRPTASAPALLLVALLVLAQGTIAFLLGEVRADLVDRSPSAILIWRLTASAAFAGLAATMAIRLRSPLQATRGWLAAALILALIAVATGWALDLAHPSSLPPLTRLRPMTGLHCIAVVIANGMPMLALVTLLLRAGAIVRPAAASAWAGLAAAATGGLVWALACPIDDPLYATFWYALAFGILTGLAHRLLPRVVRLRVPRPSQSGPGAQSCRPRRPGPGR